jgi:iduronate 2-sulfatase
MRIGLLVFAAWSLLPAGSPRAAEPRPNVLFIAVDDLRPELGCYAQAHVRSPNIDRLSARGVVFTRAYCQMASCCPSRSSLLTGLRPDATGVFGNTTHFREKTPNVVTLPQHFRAHGYHTQALGKVFHGAYETAHGGRAMDDGPSWSVPTWFGSPRNYYSPEGVAAARREFGRRSGKRGSALDAWIEEPIRTYATEAPDVADDELYDGAMTKRAIEVLGELKSKDRPFFLAVGFTRPHLPLAAPKRYWDLYDPATIDLAARDALPRGAPAVAAAPNELRNYTGMPRNGPLTAEQARTVRHGYYACISFVDAQIGRLLDELDRQGLRESTIVVLWGDHGWHLGESGLWGKNTNFESATRAPLIVFDPRAAAGSRSPAGDSAEGAKAEGAKAAGLVEFVDIYPTLCELAGLPLPGHLAGSSFAPLLSDPQRPGKAAAFSQHPRPGFTGFTTMGYSMRTDRYRLTIWRSVDPPLKTEAVELYDHQFDPGETENVAGREENAKLVEELTNELLRRTTGSP